MKSNETGTKRKVVRYTGGIAILFIIDILYISMEKWFRG